MDIQHQKLYIPFVMESKVEKSMLLEQRRTHKACKTVPWDSSATYHIFSGIYDEDEKRAKEEAIKNENKGTQEQNWELDM